MSKNEVDIDEDILDKINHLLNDEGSTTQDDDLSKSPVATNSPASDVKKSSSTNSTNPKKFKFYDLERTECVQDEEVLFINGTQIKLTLPEERELINNCLATGRVDDYGLLKRILENSGLAILPDVRCTTAITTNLNVKQMNVVEESISIKRINNSSGEVVEVKDRHVNTTANESFVEHHVNVQRSAAPSDIGDEDETDDIRMRIFQNIIEEDSGIQDEHLDYLDRFPGLRNGLINAAVYEQQPPHNKFNDLRDNPAVLGGGSHGVGGIAAQFGYSNNSLDGFYSTDLSTSSSASTLVNTKMLCFSKFIIINVIVIQRTASSSRCSVSFGRRGAHIASEIDLQLSASVCARKRRRRRHAYYRYDKTNSFTTHSRSIAEANELERNFSLSFSFQGHNTVQQQPSGRGQPNHLGEGGGMVPSSPTLVYREGLLISGDLDTLIQHCMPTATYEPCSNYLFTFLLCGRLFIPTGALLRRILDDIELYRGDRNKTLSLLLTHWVQKCPYDFLNPLLMQLLERECLISITGPLRESILRELKARLERMRLYQNYLSLLRQVTVSNEKLMDSAVLVGDDDDAVSGNGVDRSSGGSAIGSAAGDHQHHHHHHNMMNGIDNPSCESPYVNVEEALLDGTNSDHQLYEEFHLNSLYANNANRKNLQRIAELKATVRSYQQSLAEMTTAAQVAHQLTHIEVERLAFIGPEEFIQAFVKQQREKEKNGDGEGEQGPAPVRGVHLRTPSKDSSSKRDSGAEENRKLTQNLENYVQWFNRLTYLVASDIVKVSWLLVVGFCVRVYCLVW